VSVGSPTAAVYGAPLDGVAVTVVPPDLAPLLAAAHRRVSCQPAAVHLGDGRVVDPHAPPSVAGPTAPVRLDHAADVLRSASRPVVLAGPGVVLDGAVDGLRSLAASASLGVLNTWGAKGVFDWRSPHHLATAGLQARDFELAGFGAADLIVATGIDPREARSEWRLAPVLEVPPPALGALAEHVARPPGEIEVPPLRTELARVTQAGWAASSGPLAPSKVTLHYSQVVGPTGLVAADPGVSGYWVARTLPTATLGGALVTADPAGAGFAVGCALVARLLDPRRPVLAAVDHLDAMTRRILEVAAELGVLVAVEVWDDDGPVLDAEQHAIRLQDLVATGGHVPLRTDPGQLERMLEVAGPVVAWTG